MSKFNNGRISEGSAFCDKHIDEINRYHGNIVAARVKALKGALHFPA